jgi:hypothetical protein
MILRRLSLLTVLVVALAAPATGLAAGSAVTTDRGVVQAVDAGQITLRSLDGTVASFPVSAATRVKLNGARAALTDIQPGFVAAVVHDGAAPATVIRAFGRPGGVVTDRGTVTLLTRTSIAISTAGATIVTIPLDATTRFQFLGLPGRRFLARPGAVVAVRHADGGPARVVNVLKRAGA